MEAIGKVSGTETIGVSRKLGSLDDKYVVF